MGIRIPTCQRCRIRDKHENQTYCVPCRNAKGREDQVEYRARCKAKIRRRIFLSKRMETIQKLMAGRL